MNRSILHCDMNNFYASVECMLDPSLRKYPVAVCGSVEERHGIVLAKNYAAKSFDVKTGDAVWQAKQKCKDLVVVPPHYEEYIKYSKLARNVYSRYTDQVEPYGMDECWLDISGTEHYQNLLKVKSRVVNNRKPNTEYLSCHTVREVHKLLRSAFNQAVKWELMTKNPCVNATLPQEEHKARDIWDAPTLFKALELCDDDILRLAINLAFSCSLRVGEMLGLTWDCVEISDASITNGTAFIFVNKELQRVNRDALEKLNEKGIILKFPAFFARTNTALVLKEPKTKTSTRKVFLPKTVAEMLKERYQEIQEYKELFGDEFQDFNLVFCNANGRPMESQIITRALQKLIKDNDLPPVVFH